MRFCKDCIHYTEWYGPDPHYCQHPSNQRINPVTGSVWYAARASTMRGIMEKCGPDATLFEPKPVKVGFWKRLFG